MAITAACDKFIAEVLRPRFLPEICRTTFNYPVAINGKWHGNKHRFITRYRSGDPRHPHRNSMHRLPVWNTSVGIASTFPGTGIPASGVVCSSASRSP